MLPTDLAMTMFWTINFMYFLLYFLFQIWQTIMPMIICIGFFGNLVALFIAGDRKKKHPFMIRLLAVVDNMNLAVVTTDVIGRIKYGPGGMLYVLNNWGCKLGLYIVVVLQHMEAWVIIMLTVERYVSIMYPLHANRYLNLNRLKLIMSIIVVFILVEYCPHLVIQRINDDTSGFPCQPSRNWGRKWLNVNHKSELVVFGPFGILLVSNIIIILKLAKRNRKRASLGLNINQNHQKETKLRKQAPLLLSISFIFLLTHGAVYFFLRTDFGRESFSEYLKEQEQYMSLRFTCCMLLLYINYSVNFFIYVGSNAEMRKRFSGIFSRK